MISFFSGIANASIILNDSQALTIKSWVESHTKYESCSDDQRETIMNALVPGLIALRKINPQLLADRMRFNEKRQAKFNTF